MPKKSTKPAVKLSATDREELLAAIETAELIANQLDLRNPVRAELEYHRLSEAIWREGHPIRTLLQQTGEIVRQKATVTKDGDGKDVVTYTDTEGRIPTFGTTDLHRAIHGLLNTLGTWYARKATPQNVTQRERIHQPCADAVRSYCKELRKAFHVAENTEPREDIGPEERALALLVKHPGWSQSKMAEAVGVNRTTLYKFDRYQGAREILKGGKVDIPRGSKDQDGNLEAWEGDTFCDTDD